MPSRDVGLIADTSFSRLCNSTSAQVVVPASGRRETRIWFSREPVRTTMGNVCGQISA